MRRFIAPINHGCHIVVAHAGEHLQDKDPASIVSWALCVKCKSIWLRLVQCKLLSSPAMNKPARITRTRLYHEKAPVSNKWSLSATLEACTSKDLFVCSRRWDMVRPRQAQTGRYHDNCYNGIRSLFARCSNASFPPSSILHTSRLISGFSNPPL